MGLFSFIGGILGGNSQKKAADKAAQLQYNAAMAGVDETRRQFDITRGDFAPYQAAGTDALASLRGLIGLNGGDQQQSAIDALKASPFYTSLYDNGEEALMANASATGGLRGGNTQGALADFGRDTLMQTIMQQLSNYGGLVGVGAGAAESVGNFGANAVASMNANRNQGAAAQAGAALTRGGINAQNWNNAGGFLDSIASSIPGVGGIGKILF